MSFVEEDGLEDVLIVRDGSFVGGVVHAELMLVVCAVEGHFDFLHVFGVGVGVVHGSVAAGFAVLAFFFVFGKGDLLFLLLVLGFGAEVGVEVGFVILGKVFAVGVGDGDVVEEVRSAEDELFSPGSGFAEELKSIVGENAHDHVVELFCDRGGASVTTFPLAGVSLALFGIEGCGFENDAFLRPRLDRCDIGICANGDTLGFQIVGPVAIE